MSTISTSVPIAVPCLTPSQTRLAAIAALLARDDRHADPLGPDLELADRGGAEGVAGDQHHLIVLLLEQMRELGDRRGLARSVDADHQDHLRAREGVDLERLGDRAQDLGDLLGDDRADAAPRRAPRSKRSSASRSRMRAAVTRAEIGGDQRLLDLVELRVVEPGLADEPGEVVGQPLGRLAKAAEQPLRPAVAARRSRRSCRAGLRSMRVGSDGSRCFPTGVPAGQANAGEVPGVAGAVALDEHR